MKEGTLSTDILFFWADESTAVLKASATVTQGGRLRDVSLW